MTILVVAASLASALAFAVSTNLKHSSASELPVLGRLDVRGVIGFVDGMIKHPIWLLGIVADGAGLGLQIVALHLGALSVVQPLMISGLLFSLAIRQLRSRQFQWVDAAWAATVAAALVGFLIVSGTASNPQSAAAADRWPAVTLAAVGVVVAVGAVWAGRRRGPAVASAALLGVAVGVIYAADAALLKSTTNRATAGLSHLLISWQLYAVIAVGVIGLVMVQFAYQAGPLTASQPTIAAVDPLASVAIGVLIFDEHLRRGPWTGVGLVALVVLLAVSVFQLGRREASQ